jgi:hypothetical protein
VADAVDHNAVACYQFVIAVVETEFNRALDNEIEINGVSLVESGPFTPWIPSCDHPVQGVGSHPKVQ